MDSLWLSVARPVRMVIAVAVGASSALLLAACGHGASNSSAVPATPQTPQSQELPIRPVPVVDAKPAGAPALCPCPAGGLPLPTTGGKAATSPATSGTNTLANPSVSASDETLLRLLAYADQVRAMPANELGQESKRLADLAMPAEQLRLALVLSQSRQSGELARGQELVGRVLANASPEAQTLHPLARLMGSRLIEQRRQEDTIERQSQQLRDVQRRLEQTTERLEALKAIERSINSRSTGGVGGLPNRVGASAGAAGAAEVGSAQIGIRAPAARASNPRRPASGSSP